ncbi:tol-pal system protein YbgF [Ideonella sp.]|uniref:tol-pal system protein YbgF n=1 Tax=Ideonella sp. TaxID=1929293 RepID=UPI003BB48A43
MSATVRCLRPVAVLLGVWLAMAPAHAGLFEDEEARKAILDLRSRQSQTDELLRTQLKQMADQIQQLQRSLLDLNGQNEQLRSEVARLRGQDEQILRDLSEVQRRQRDIAQGVDDRMRKLEPQAVTIDGREFTVEPDERKAYDEAMGSLRSGDFEKAAMSLQLLLKRFPGTGYADSARYWLGNAQYGLRDYKNAIATFKQFLAATTPEHPRAAEAQLAVANCQAEMKDTRGAKRTLEELIKQYPKSEAAQAAKERLVSLK